MKIPVPTLWNRAALCLAAPCLQAGSVSSSITPHSLPHLGASWLSAVGVLCGHTRWKSMGRGDAVLGEKKCCWKCRQRMGKVVLVKADGSMRCQVSGLQEGELIIQGLQWWDRRCLKHCRGAGRKQECWVPLQRTSKGHRDNVSPCSGGGCVIWARGPRTKTRGRLWRKGFISAKTADENFLKNSNSKLKRGKVESKGKQEGEGVQVLGFSQASVLSQA